MGAKSKFPTVVSSRWKSALLGALVAGCGGGCLGTEAGERYASVVDGHLGTPFVDPSAPHADPARALGPPDGRTVALGEGASITLRFFRDIPNGAGPDLRVVEIGPDDAQALVAVSMDGRTFLEMKAPAQAGGASIFDLDDVGLPTARLVRIRGLDSSGVDPGFDLDAIEALH